MSAPASISSRRAHIDGVRRSNSRRTMVGRSPRPSGRAGIRIGSIAQSVAKADGQVALVAAKPQAQLASAPEGSVILSLSLGGVGKLIRAPRPKVRAAERQVQLAHSPIRARAYEPPPQPTERWAGGCEIDCVANLQRFV